MLFCCKISLLCDLRCFVANLFCRYLRAVAWRKIGPKMLSVEKKGQIWGMGLQTPNFGWPDMWTAPYDFQSQKGVSQPTKLKRILLWNSFILSGSSLFGLATLGTVTLSLFCLDSFCLFILLADFYIWDSVCLFIFAINSIVSTLVLTTERFLFVSKLTWHNSSSLHYSTLGFLSNRESLFGSRHL